jgi:hypothetical protein
MRKTIAKNDKLDDVYKRAVKIDEIINPIFKSIKK